MENIESGKKREFNETLTELVEFATVSGNRLTTEQIRLYFKDIIDDESKYEHIYSYLRGLKIEIVDRKPEAEDRKHIADEQRQDVKVVGKQETDEARAFYDMYMKELGEIDTGADRAERSALLDRMADGDREAAALLTQLYLPLVIEISEEYMGSRLGRSDLVAEGNLALFEAGIEYSGDRDIEQYEKYISDRVRRSMEKAAYEELGSNRTSDHLVERINALNDASTEMAKELGREASLQELSDRLALSEDEIKELMKISIDALTIDEGEQ